jgi:hypothetical protein
VDNPTFGQRIRFDRADVRQRTTSSYQSNGRGGWMKEWAKRSWSKPGQLEGILIGIRTLSNGWVTYGDEFTPTRYEAVDHFTAYLIAYDTRRSPVYLLPEDCELL